MNDVSKTHVRLANGKLRAKPGFGKQPQVTATMLKRIEHVRSNEEANQASDLDALHRFTEIFISRARDLAKAGKKDSARNWLHFFEGARIEQTLRAHNPAQAAGLSEKLTQLRGDCHPAESVSHETDLQFIRAALEQIQSTLERAGTQTMTAPAKPARSRGESPAPSFSRNLAKRLVQKF